MMQALSGSSGNWLPCEGETARLALRPREAAASLGISERSLWSWTKEGKIPHVRLGRNVLYPVAALEAWLAEQAKAKKCLLSD